MRKEFSYGVIPLYKSWSWEIKVLLIYQKVDWSWKFGFWWFPKWHQEQGEAPVETARRELIEETGLPYVQLQTENVYTIQYTVGIYDEPIDKTSSYFVWFVQNDDINIQEEELLDAQRCTLQEAKEKISHDNMREIFVEAMNDLSLSF